LIELYNRGKWVTISGKGERKISGWLMGEIPQGLLVALDEKLEDIRLVSTGCSYGIIYNNQKTHPVLYYENAKGLQTRLEELNSILSPQLERVFSRLKYDRLHSFSHKSSLIRHQLRRWEFEESMRWKNNPYESSLSDLIGYLAAQTDQAIDLHREVYDTVEDSGLAEIMSEYGPKLAELPTELTLPADDLKFEERNVLTSALENSRKRPWSSENHRSILQQVEATRTTLLIKAIKSCRGNERTDKLQSDNSTFLSRWLGPTTRILAGTGLVAANAALGITAGLTATLATIGATSVPIYVAIVTSIYTGSVQVAEGLEKIGRSGG
jgi:hypothetical protein